MKCVRCSKVICSTNTNDSELRIWVQEITITHVLLKNIRPDSFFRQSTDQKIIMDSTWYSRELLKIQWWKYISLFLYIIANCSGILQRYNFTFNMTQLTPKSYFYVPIWYRCFILISADPEILLCLLVLHLSLSLSLKCLTPLSPI